MKKFLAILMAICMMASLLCIPAFAAESADELPAPAAGTVLRITAIKGDSIELVGDHTSFEDGWNDAMEYANDMEDYGYDRIVVDLYADWTAAPNGDFTDDFFNGAGFKWDTIYFNDEVRMTLNMNGHTINRRCPRGVENGEVIYIDDDADVIINDGTITGGNSYTGAGGIHVIDDAKLTLNNVHIIGNIIDDCDGAGMVLDGAHLIMNGGSFQNNVAGGESLNAYGGAIYINDGSATFNGVTFKNNVVKEDNHYGVAIYADDSTVTINECVIDGNGVKNDANKALVATSIIHAVDSSITVKKTSFTNNGDIHYEGKQNNYKNVSALFLLDDSTLIMEDHNSITNNRTAQLIQAIDGGEFFISDTTFTNNNSIVLSSDFHINDRYFLNCTFNNNKISDYDGSKYSFASHTFITQNSITFYDCDMGDSTYSNPESIRFVNENLEGGIVLTVSALKTDGTTVQLEEFRSFEDGWNYAMDLSNQDYWMRIENMYMAIVVDLHDDWIAASGKFTQALINGAGFSNDTLYIPEGATLVLNMNGYKIDRGLTDNISDGEVIYISSGAEVTINNGTITGGYSDNGTGGILVNGAYLTLNNVHLDGNHVEDDDGSAIALYDATLVMTGGSISNNEMRRSFKSFITPHGALYLNDSTASLKNVEFINNAFSGNDSAEGVAIYGEESTLVAENCTFKGNGNKKLVYQGANPDSVICIDEGSMEFINCVFEDGGTPDTISGPRVFELWGGTVKVTESVFRNNICDSVIWSFEGILQISDSTFEGHTRRIFLGEVDEGSYFKNCNFSGNTTDTNYKTFEFDDGNKLTFENCEFGDATFNDTSRATFVNNTANGKSLRVGSIFGEGSLTMIVAILALASSAVSISLTVYYNKKKAAPATADEVAETEDEE